MTQTRETNTLLFGGLGLAVVVLAGVGVYVFLKVSGMRQQVDANSPDIERIVTGIGIGPNNDMDVLHKSEDGTDYYFFDIKCDVAQFEQWKLTDSPLQEMSQSKVIKAIRNHGYPMAKAISDESKGDTVAPGSRSGTTDIGKGTLHSIFSAAHQRFIGLYVVTE